MIDASFGIFLTVAYMEKKIVLGNNFYMGNLFFYFSTSIYFNKHTRYFSCHKTDHAPLTIFKKLCLKRLNVFIYQTH